MGRNQRAPFRAVCASRAASVTLGVAVLWSIGGCDSGKPTPATTSANTAADSSAAADGVEPDVAVVADVPLFASDAPPADQSGAKDMPTLDLSSTTEKCNLASPQPGACGWSCTDNSACSAGFCIPTRSDRVCTGNCQYSTECPADWTCAQLAGAPDTVYGCIPQSPNLGRPCAADLDCVMMVGQTVVGLTDMCIPQGTEGAFCANDCSATQKCATGFTCKTVKTMAGKDKKACIADKLSDNCTPRFEFEKAETACSNQNKSGICMGKRHCDKGKLSDCDALTPASEVCNGKDDDCDGTTDEPVAGAVCQITVGSAQCPGTPLCIAGKETCVGTPPTSESCNGKDDDCDSKVDEGCDDDQDGYCDSGMAYDPATKACPKGPGDCDDLDAGRFPGAKETCNSADDNCNGMTDGDDPTLLLNDAQKCEKQQGVCQGATKGAGLCQGGKWLACADADYQKWSAAYSATELCDDKDNDCSGKADDGCNDDLDGYCDAAMATVGFPLSCTKGGGDCDDADKSVVPGATEICDDKDQNCSGQVDEGCDDDKDGQCDAALGVVGVPKICPVLGGGDCDDLNPKRYKGAKELCNGVDDDCSGGTDEGYADLGKACADGKGICELTGTVVCAADGSAAVCSVGSAKAQVEMCDNLDNDCDGQTDEGCDDDMDGYCDAEMATAGKPKACFLGAGDCNDNLGSVHPINKEVCNGLDDDCDGKTDADDGDIAYDDPQFCEKQLGTCKGAKKPASLCAGGKWLACTNEQYGSWTANFSAAEVCDAADNDCNGTIDEGCDDDNDGFCNKNMKVLGFVPTCDLGINDCNDKNTYVHPFADELCDNLDNDCDLKIDEDCDKDFDNYCAADKTIPSGVTPQACTAGGGDCDDLNFKINPGIKDQCADFLDNNCNGQTDEGCAPTIIGFSGSLGPDFKSEGLLQCAGYYDQANIEDVPLGWGLDCASKDWSKLRIACGSGPGVNQIRYIDVKKNVFLLGINGGVEYGLISNANFDLKGENTIKADTDNPNNSRSWWVSTLGCSEALSNLTVNNPSCPWEAANCFGQNLSGPRYLYVYVGK